ncbi:MAG: geranylgeranylglyceryl/heptaprenylglyceryl phosphate synthase [Candidatus Poribacteria bacterium]|nr:geranylgeranylglyceryl/heptaprenylglyceryl phosphate synthase [Candidatus Poribacteria bacterium]MDE0502999.1 geranylgeranylglyceryl/heptaprenylglyceryl phosphate synthase [Candidatus Poribacteria bacterium]
MQTGTILNYLHQTIKRYRAGYLVLIDPDQFTVSDCVESAHQAEEAGTDALLLGGSFLTTDLQPVVEILKKETRLPIILFPGDAMHLSPHADAILYLSLISGRNANFLIGEQVKAAPRLRQYDIEPIPTGYMLIDSGRQTSVGFISGTTPLPRDKSDLAWAHALAAEYLGMQLVYLEAGSGAEQPVPNQMITTVKEHISIPVLVGGGITTPEIAAQKVEAGADFIVTGTVIENNRSLTLMKQFADAVHG